MKKIFYIAILSVIFIAAVSSETLYTIVTSKENALINKRYTAFIMVDDQTNFVVGKSPRKYDISSEMPLNYFTITLPENASTAQRIFVIHNIVTENNPDNYDWVLEDNPDEHQIFYSRKNFIAQATSMQWIMIVRSERILLKNIRTRNYVKLLPDGKFASTTDENDASRFKLIHIY